MNCAPLLLQCLRAPPSARPKRGPLEPPESAFERAPPRLEMQRLLFHEAFAECRPHGGTCLHETWFTRENGLVVREAWRACCAAQLDVVGRQQQLECEVVVHLPAPVAPGSAACWPTLCFPPAPSPAEEQVYLERVEHAAADEHLRRVWRAGAAAPGAWQRKTPRSRHRLSVPDSPARLAQGAQAPRAHVQVSTEADEETSEAVGAVRYKAVRELPRHHPAWRLLLVAEVQWEGAPLPDAPAPSRALELLGGAATAAEALSALAADAATAARALGAPAPLSGPAQWRVELEFAPLPSRAHFEAGVVAALLSATRALLGPGLAPGAVSVAAGLVRGWQEPPSALDCVREMVDRLAQRHCRVPADAVARRARPHELTAATLAQTAGMAVTAKSDGRECVLFVLPVGVAWLASGAEVQFARGDMPPAVCGAVLSAELMGDGVAVVNDAWHLPGHEGVGAQPLLLRAALYAAYVGALGPHLPPDAPRVAAKRWHYSFDADREDVLRAVEDAWAGGRPADGLVFCDPHRPACAPGDGADQRALLKLKPVFTVDLLRRDGRLWARAGDGELVDFAPVPVSGPPAEDGTVHEYAIARAGALEWVRARPDKRAPNLLRAAREMVEAARALPDPLAAALRLRNGARAFRHAMNRRKRALLARWLLAAEPRATLVVDLGVGGDVGKYLSLLGGAAGRVRLVLGVDLDPARLEEAARRVRQQQQRTRAGPPITLLRGDLNAPATQRELRAHVRPDDVVVVVSNYTAGYVEHPDRFFAFVADLVGARGRFVGLFHDWERIAALGRRRPAREPPADLPPAEDAAAVAARLADDLARGRTSWTLPLAGGAVPLVAVAPYLVAGVQGSRGHWFLLSPGAPSFHNVESAVGWREWRDAAARAGLRAVHEGPSEQQLRGPVPASVEDTAVEFCFRAAGGDGYLAEPVAHPRPLPADYHRHVAGPGGAVALPPCAEPVALPARGDALWTLHVAAGPCAAATRAGDALPSRRVHLPLGVPPHSVLRAFLAEDGALSLVDAPVCRGEDLSALPYTHRRAHLCRSGVPAALVAPARPWWQDGDDDAPFGRLYLAAHLSAGAPPLHVAGPPHWTPLVSSREEYARLALITRLDRLLPEPPPRAVAVRCREPRHFDAALAWARARGVAYVRYVPQAAARSVSVSWPGGALEVPDPDRAGAAGLPDACCLPGEPAPGVRVGALGVLAAGEYAPWSDDLVRVADDAGPGETPHVVVDAATGCLLPEGSPRPWPEVVAVYARAAGASALERLCPHDPGFASAFWSRDLPNTLTPCL